jgi:hypothetical protein
MSPFAKTGSEQNVMGLTRNTVVGYRRRAVRGAAQRGGQVQDRHRPRRQPLHRQIRASSQRHLWNECVCALRGSPCGDTTPALQDDDGGMHANSPDDVIM